MSELVGFEIARSRGWNRMLGCPTPQPYSKPLLRSHSKPSKLCKTQNERFVVVRSGKR